MDELQWIREGLAKPGKTKSGLAAALGRAPSAVTALLKGERELKVREIPLIERYLETAAPHGAMRRAAETARDEDDSDADLPPPAPNAAPGEAVRFTRNRLPVYGHAVGGEDGRFILNGQQVADVLTPPALERVPNAYAVYIHGESMVPRYYPGETAWIHPGLPVKQGDFVVAQIRSEDPGEPPLGFVKQFISRSPRELVLRQLNPPEGQDELMRFPGDRVVSVHKILFAGQS